MKGNQKGKTPSKAPTPADVRQALTVITAWLDAESKAAREERKALNKQLRVLPLISDDDAWASYYADSTRVYQRQVNAEVALAGLKRCAKELLPEEEVAL